MLAKPDWLNELGNDLGTDELAQFIIPPRIKIVQPTSGEPFDQWPAGTVLLSPNLIEIPVPFTFTPIFFKPEWLTWNPYNMKETLPAIRERSLDPKSDIAIKAQSPNSWREPCPENPEEELSHREHLNWLILIHDVPAIANQPVALSFAASEHSVGRKFAGLIRMRRAHIYTCVFEAGCSKRTKTKGKYFGLDITNPSEVAPFVDRETAIAYKSVYEQMKETEIRIDHSDDEVINGEVVTADSGEF
jgi:hypothetical protein